MPETIDLRSDTVTKPSYEMYNAMTQAPVGDDVYIEDPTVLELEKQMAPLCGMEAALFVCTGTMGNQVSLKVHLSPLEEAIVDARCHIYRYELGGIHYHSGASVKPVMPSNGKYLTVQDIEPHIFSDNNWHTPKTRIICLENATSGMVIPLHEVQQIRELAKKRNLLMHLDGARLWNALVATGHSLKDYCEQFDSVSICFSKGMGAPIGSVIVGSRQFIENARMFRVRKKDSSVSYSFRVEGGWRQGGVLAGACLYALEHNLAKIKLDHENAKKMEAGLLEMGFQIDYPVETNMLFVNSTVLGVTFDELAKQLAQLAQQHSAPIIKLSPSGHKCRIVLHLDVSAKQVESVLHWIKMALGK